MTLITLSRLSHIALHVPMLKCEKVFFITYNKEVSPNKTNIFKIKSNHE